MKTFVYHSILISLFCCPINGVTQNLHKTSKVELLGILNDTAFSATSRECYIIYKSFSNTLELTIPLASFSTGNPDIDSLLFINKTGNLTIINDVEGDIFDFLNTENSTAYRKLSGELIINNHKQNITKNYRIYTSLSNKLGKKTIFLDARFYFNPKGLNGHDEITLNDPLEAIILGGYVNQKD